MRAKPLCFVIMPFGKDNSPERERYSTVYEYIIRKPILDEGFECIRGDEILAFRPIPDQIKTKLIDADLVVADLSGRNPNVFYELGYRHAVGIPTISISDDLDGLPFDVASYRTILYKLDDVRVIERCRQVIAEYASHIRKSIERKHETTQDSTKQKTGEAFAPRLETDLTIGLSNIYQVISELSSKITTESDLGTKLNELQNNIIAQGTVLASIQAGLSQLKEELLVQKKS